ncbi:nucleoside hydrolase [Levilactobacillus brevis]|jgi:purine nucleosidase|uniref:Inosine-uridine nucleoside N-ribohydrolase n=2 Tax=Levilactobacillus brevis TaxID=1580 RepID=Q03TA7_LEVBA|nr:nucleoside hydrolase [Levilactobacillus brevis]MBL3535882.1 nucleoside hydrolase [Lactobacillus sp. GPR40-2]MBL3629331.1 nucleoside hydrolase [Lactobacillus sp. GPB7-4]ABJ63565.1 Inosine-uridine nucleoside N-ribohydrolase [Levilactobacillus brevis ATCC 367]ARQ93305.1 ABC transporter substrate-binding protein [Levilactobacillus brevis]ARW21322.1 Purine nucleosidase [Levilactobacillus brevis]
MRNVYFNHDGSVDDLVSLLLLLQMPDVHLTGVGVVGADSYLEPALAATRKVIDRFGHDTHLKVAVSDSRGVHPFPKEWRLDAFSLDALPILNESGTVVTPVAPKPAHLDLVDKLQTTSEKTTLVMTGPLTDLARALQADPSITAKIEQLYWMGGTFDGRGNVAEPEQDGTTEWNAYWDPQAVKTVWDSDLTIQMVGLESTRQVPLTPAIRQHWATLRQHPAIDFIGQGYALVPALQHFETNSTYFLWDVLTTVASEFPEIVTTKRVTSDVLTEGPGRGRTFETPTGRPVTLVTTVDHDAFFKRIDTLALHADK